MEGVEEENVEVEDEANPFQEIPDKIFSLIEKNGGEIDHLEM